MVNLNLLPDDCQVGSKYVNLNQRNRWEYITIRGQSIRPMTDIGRANGLVFCIAHDGGNGFTDVTIRLRKPVVMRVQSSGGAWTLTRQAKLALYAFRGVAFWIAKEGGASYQPTLLLPYDEPFSKGTEARRMVLNPAHPDVKAGIDGKFTSIHEVMSTYGMKRHKQDFDSVTGRIASRESALVRTQNASRRIMLAKELLDLGWTQKAIAAHPEINCNARTIRRWFE